MKRYFLIFVSVLAVAGITAGFSMSNGSTKLTSSQIANLEALTEDEEGRYYEKINRSEMEIWDDGVKAYKKMIFIECIGKGNVDCA